MHSETNFWLLRKDEIIFMSFQPFTTASQSFAPMQESVEGGVYLRLSDQASSLETGIFHAPIKR